MALGQGPGARPLKITQKPGISGGNRKAPKPKPSKPVGYPGTPGGARPPRVTAPRIGGEPKNQAPFTRPVQTPGKTPVVKRTVTGTPPPRTTGLPRDTSRTTTPSMQPALTPAQQASQAIDAELAPLYSQQNTQSSRENAAIQAFTQAIIQQLSGMPGQVAGAYDTSIGQTSDIAKAAAGSLQAANPNAQDQSLLASLGAPQGQRDIVAGQNNAAFNGGAGVGLYTNGVLPVGDLVAQKLAAVNLAAGRPAIEGLRGQQSLLSALAKQQDANAAIGAQRPDLIQKWLDSYNTAQYQNQTLAQKQADATALQKYRYDALNSTNAYRNAQVKLAGAKVDQAGQKLAWQQTYQTGLLTLKQQGLINQQQYQRLTLQLKNKSLNSTNAYRQAQIALKQNGSWKIGGSDKTGRFLYNSQDPSQRVPFTPAVKANQPTASNPFPNLTKQQVQHLRSGMATSFYGRPEQKDPTGKKVIAQKLPRQTYGEAITEAVKAGYSRAAATQMANRFYKPGGTLGRPKGSAAQGAASGASYSNPVPGASFERVDQGVDYMARSPVGALGSGTVLSINKGMAGGTGDIIKMRLDKPVRVNGRTYRYIYYSEEKPLVRVGQKVHAGQAVMGAGGNEIGFLNNDLSFPPLVGGLGSGTQQTQQGKDFLAFLQSLGAAV